MAAARGIRFITGLSWRSPTKEGFMKRSGVIGFALLTIVAVSAFGAIGAVAHKTKKPVATTVTATFVPGDPSGGSGQIKDGEFSGKVGSTKPPCLKGRTVVVARVAGSEIGQAKTDAAGNWSVKAKDPQPSAGEQYSVTVLKQKIVKRNDENHRHIIKCLSVSETITIPTP
jgi:hypothetical protein